jgi:hypothetical protein
LEGINENIKNDVLICYECMKYEYGDFDKETIRDLIIALEKMIEKMEN